MVGLTMAIERFTRVVTLLTGVSVVLSILALLVALTR